MHLLIKANVFAKNDDNLDKQLLFCDTFRLLIEKGCDINAKDENGCTSLHYAALKNSFIGAMLLIDVPGISINVIFSPFFLNLLETLIK
jgi:ankyrin repeat protein